MEKFIDAVLGTIKSVSDRLSARIDAVEQRASVPARDGRDGVGVQGPKGDSGDRGDVGPIGPSGKSFLVGSGAPASAGQSGDSYLDIKTGDVYQGLVSGWQLIGQMPIGNRVEPAPLVVPKSYDSEIACLASQVAAARTELGDTVDKVNEAIQKGVADAIAAFSPVDGKDGRDGLSVTVDDVAPLINALVTKAVAGIRAPLDGADGKSVTVADVAPLVVAEVSKAVAALPVPKDAVGVKGAVIDRTGQLVLTMTDGSLQELGVVIGRDGKDADVSELEKQIALRLAEIKQPADGRHGKDGQDGIALDLADLKATADYDGERSLVLTFERGEHRKSIALHLPTMIYRDVWQEGKPYDSGDVVTWGGSMWVATKATEAKPDTTTADSRAWKLCCKRGRDGKGVKGDQGEKGLDGKHGKDMTPDMGGRKW